MYALAGETVIGFCNNQKAHDTSDVYATGTTTISRSKYLYCLCACLFYYFQQSFRNHRKPLPYPPCSNISPVRIVRSTSGQGKERGIKLRDRLRWQGNMSSIFLQLSIFFDQEVSSHHSSIHYFELISLAPVQVDEQLFLLHFLILLSSSARQWATIAMLRADAIFSK